MARTSSPRFGRRLVARLLAHGVRLAPVLGNSSVDDPARRQSLREHSTVRGVVLDNVRANRRPEDIRKRVGLVAGLAFRPNDADDGSARHFEGVGR
jgi:hypothetical protein